MPEHSLLNEACLRGQLVTQSLTCWAPKPAHSSHPIPPKQGGEKVETLVRFTVQRHRLNKDWDLVIGWQSPCPPPCLSTLHEDYLKQFPLSDIWCVAAISKNYKAYQRAKNNLKRVIIRAKHGKDIGIIRLRI